MAIIGMVVWRKALPWVSSWRGYRSRRRWNLVGGSITRSWGVYSLAQFPTPLCPMYQWKCDQWTSCSCCHSLSALMDSLHTHMPLFPLSALVMPFYQVAIQEGCFCQSQCPLSRQEGEDSLSELSHTVSSLGTYKGLDTLASLDTFKSYSHGPIDRQS